MNPPPPRFSDMENQAFAIATRALADGFTPAKAAAAAESVTAAADEFLSMLCRTIDLTPVLSQIACGAGCSTCCHQIVALTMAEAQRIAQFIHALPPEQKNGILFRATQATTQGAGLDPRQWWVARITCPLLDQDQGCQIYPVRPLPCRGYNSLDVDACKRSLAGEALSAPVVTAQVRVYAHAQIGLSKALAAAGMPHLLGRLAETVAGMGEQGEVDRINSGSRVLPGFLD